MKDLDERIGKNLELIN